MRPLCINLQAHKYSTRAPYSGESLYKVKLNQRRCKLTHKLTVYGDELTSSVQLLHCALAPVAEEAVISQWQGGRSMDYERVRQLQTTIVRIKRRPVQFYYQRYISCSLYAQLMVGTFVYLSEILFYLLPKFNIISSSCINYSVPDQSKPPKQNF